MSILSWFLKPKKEMAKLNTKKVKVGRYKISSHTQNRMVQKDRQLKKSDITSNLLLKPDYVSKVDKIIILIQEFEKKLLHILRQRQMS